jgi:hypothetical protein
MRREIRCHPCQSPSCHFRWSHTTGTGRKIAHLEKLGWVERAERREVRITRAVARHFQPDFNLNLLSNLLKTADRIRGLPAT